jgi:proton-dependent oligopeptide transporter, POT family
MTVSTLSTVDRPVPEAPREGIWRGAGGTRTFTTLFMVDVWERFSFYGMLAILYLYFVATPAEGGVGLAPGTAAGLFGVYIASTFIAALPGGWIADRVLGPRRTLLVGGVVIASGHYALALPFTTGLVVGLPLIVIGTGLVKPSMLAMIGELHPARPDRREAAFSFFYMSIQFSALLAPLATGWLAERVNWHLGFAVAGVGMTIGVIRYAVGLRHFGDLGAAPVRPASPTELARVGRRGGVAVLVVAGLLGIDHLAGTLQVRHLLVAIGLVSLVAPFAYLSALTRRITDRAAVARIRTFRWLMLASALFWGLFSQGGSLLGLFAKEHTDRTVGSFTVPASWLQSAHPLFVLALAPAFAWLWLRIGRRIAAPAKFAGAVAAMGVSYLVIAVGAQIASAGPPVSPVWLLAVYALHACGELVLASVALSLAAEVAPPGYAAQMVGVFWLFAALGVGVFSQVAQLSDVLALPAYFAVLGVVAVVVAGAYGWAAPRLGRALHQPVA